MANGLPGQADELFFGCLVELWWRQLVLPMAPGKPDHNQPEESDKGITEHESDHLRSFDIQSDQNIEKSNQVREQRNRRKFTPTVTITDEHKQLE